MLVSTGCRWQPFEFWIEDGFATRSSAVHYHPNDFTKPSSPAGPTSAPTNQQRRDALADVIDSYNQTRPHSELGGQPPMTILVNHLCGKDT